MDDVFKSKLKTLIQKAKLGDKGDGDEDFRNWLPQSVALEAAERERRALVTHPIPLTALEEDDVLATMERKYYDENFEASRHELNKYENAGNLDQEGIDVHRQRLLRQLKVVTKRTYARILEQRPKCTDEMERVTEITSQVEDALTLCRKGRRGLLTARQQFTSSSLGILAACKRRERAAALVEDLMIISTLQKTDERLQELLGKGNYPGAIQLLLEGQKAVQTYKHFVAIQQLSVKLQDTLELAEEQLDVALSKVCVSFDREKYSLLMEAYSLLGTGKTQSSMDQLLMHLTSAIHNTAWNVVYGHAVLSSTDSAPEELGKKLYIDICSSVASTSLLPCLVDLCKALWNIMNSFKKIFDFHKSTPKIDLSEEEDLEKQYIEKKLTNGLSRIWQDVQTKIRQLMVANVLSGLTIDQFLKVTDVLHTLMESGNRFCGSSSSNLQQSLKEQCLQYFQHYHMERLRDIKMHLENETWVCCPVKDTFSIYHLLEFSHVKRAPSQPNSPSKKLTRWPEKCPFDQIDECGQNEEDFLYNNLENDNSDDDIPDELKKDFVEEEGRFVTSTPARKKKPPKELTNSGPILTTTSLMLLRLCGKYLHLMSMLQPIAKDVFIAMTQLLEYYFLNVHNLFTKDLRIESQHVCAKINAVISRISLSLLDKNNLPQVTSNDVSNHISNISRSVTINFPTITLNATGDSSSLFKNNSFIARSNEVLNDSTVTGDENGNPDSLNLELAGLNFQVNLEDPENLHGFTERFIAAESLLYVVSQFRELKKTILQSVPKEEGEDDDDFINDYFSKTVEVFGDVRKSIYLSVAEKAISSESTLQKMSKVSWDVREVQSQHNQYVDVLLRELQVFGMRLQEMDCNVKFSKESKDILWAMCSFASALIFVEGFSNVKKCSNEGRALMQLDYRQFVIKLEKICEMKPLPHQDYVVQYIQAFYIPEVELENWVKYHTEYSAKQLVSLVNSVAYSNNKTRQKLNSLINELSGKMRRQQL